MRYSQRLHRVCAHHLVRQRAGKSLVSALAPLGHVRCGFGGVVLLVLLWPSVSVFFVLRITSKIANSSWRERERENQIAEAERYLVLALLRLLPLERVLGGLLLLGLLPLLSRELRACIFALRFALLFVLPWSAKYDFAVASTV
jgi:hypothetical protein